VVLTADCGVGGWNLEVWSFEYCKLLSSSFLWRCLLYQYAVQGGCNVLRYVDEILKCEKSYWVVLSLVLFNFPYILVFFSAFIPINVFFVSPLQNIFSLKLQETPEATLIKNTGWFIRVNMNFLTPHLQNNVQLSAEKFPRRFLSLMYRLLEENIFWMNSSIGSRLLMSGHTFKMMIIRTCIWLYGPFVKKCKHLTFDIY